MNAANMPFAFLPMYDLPALRQAWDRLWQITHGELAQAGISAEPQLRRQGSLFDLWSDPDLLMGHTCGWPFISMLTDKVVPFARFDFGLEGLDPGDYQSVFVAREPDAAQSPADLEELLLDPATRIAVNDLLSQSGYRVLGECVSKPVTLAKDQLVATGSHANSAKAVAKGKASLAAIDAVTWRYLLNQEPSVGSLVEIARSSGVPGLPLITSNSNNNLIPELFAALKNALASLDGETTKKLGIRGLVPANAADYDLLKQEPFGRVSFEPV